MRKTANFIILFVALASSFTEPQAVTLYDFPKFENMQAKFICDNSVLNLSCDASSVIDVKSVYYGRASSVICAKGRNADQGCDLVDQKKRVRQKCNNSQTCTINPPFSDFFGYDQCPTIDKYINIIYGCVSNPDVEFPKSTLPTTMPSTPSPTIPNITSATPNATQATNTQVPRKPFLTEAMRTEDTGTPKAVPTFNPDAPGLGFLFKNGSRGSLGKRWLEVLFVVLLSAFALL
ncbi:uncharacterized protein LOC5505118 [Nematostella vectensis]|uniref:uncharacterized protein LOC5505118 n=1 Tax=Nematostella vectensis TaxID=45351 RepID=UPI00138FD169|nr:uncharacterized protein LOC5505118 [Nematostella vectensis]